MTWAKVKVFLTVCLAVLTLLADLATLVPGFSEFLYRVPDLLLATDVPVLVPVVLTLATVIAVGSLLRGRIASRNDNRPTAETDSVSAADDEGPAADDVLTLLSRLQAERSVEAKHTGQRNRSRDGARAIRPPRLEKQDFDR